MYKFEKNHLFGILLVFSGVPFFLDAVFNLFLKHSDVTVVTSLLCMVAFFTIFPLAIILEIIWIIYFLFSGMSFYDSDVRKKYKREYSKLIPHFVAWVILCLFLLFYGYSHSPLPFGATAS